MFRFFIPIILIGFSVILSFGYTKPNLTVIASAKSDVVFVTSTLSTKKEEIELKKKALEETRKSIVQEDRVRVKKLVPSFEEYDEAAFINDINNIAMRHSMFLRGVSISGIKTEAEDIGSKKVNTGVYTNYEAVSISFSVESTYPEFKEFLNDIERSEQLLDITGISFSSASDTEKGGYRVTIKAYYLIP